MLAAMTSTSITKISRLRFVQELLVVLLSFRTPGQVLYMTTNSSFAVLWLGIIHIMAAMYLFQLLFQLSICTCSMMDIKITNASTLPIPLLSFCCYYHYLG